MNRGSSARFKGDHAPRVHHERSRRIDEATRLLDIIASERSAHTAARLEQRIANFSLMRRFVIRAMARDEIDKSTDATCIRLTSSDREPRIGRGRSRMVDSIAPIGHAEIRRRSRFPFAELCTNYATRSVVLSVAYRDPAFSRVFVMRYVELAPRDLHRAIAPSRLCVREFDLSLSRSLTLSFFSCAHSPPGIARCGKVQLIKAAGLKFNARHPRPSRLKSRTLQRTFLTG